MRRFSLLILYAVFALSAAASVVYSADTVNVVAVRYNGTTAAITVSTNIRQYVKVAERGAYITLTQDTLVSESTCGEIIYQLYGTTKQGSFTMAGSYKSALELFGVSITNPSGPAVDIQNGKRIEISCKKETVSTLTDGTSTDTAAWKGALQCTGHIQFKGKGTLDIYGNYAHGIWSREYIEMKNCTINVWSAGKDAVNCNQYFRMDSGVLSLSGFADDGIDVSKKSGDVSAENTGNFILNGGTVVIDMKGAAGRSINAEGSVTKNGGTLTVKNAPTGVENVFAESEPVEVYSLTGMPVGQYESAHEALRRLPSGVYVLKQKQSYKKLQIL